MEQQHLEPRVLGLACELLGRHAATVQAMSMSGKALDALVRAWVCACVPFDRMRPLLLG